MAEAGIENVQAHVNGAVKAVPDDDTVKAVPVIGTVKADPAAAPESDSAEDSASDRDEEEQSGDEEQPKKKKKTKSPLSKSQVKLILSTWAPVKPNMEKHGIVLFMRLFQICPELIHLFPFNEVTEDTPGLKKHAVDVMESIDKAVELLKVGEVDELQEVLVDLGIIHHMKDVEVKSFGPVGEALLYALEQGLGDMFTDEVKDAWVTLYKVVEACMTQGMKEGLADY